MDASSQAASVGTNPDPRGGWVEPQYAENPAAQLLSASLGIYYHHSSCYHHVTILGSFSARQTPCSAPNRTKNTPMDASSLAASVGTEAHPWGGCIEP